MVNGITFVLFDMMTKRMVMAQDFIAMANLLTLCLTKQVLCTLVELLLLGKT